MNRTRLRARQFDRERERLYGADASLVLFEKLPGKKDAESLNSLLAVPGGWLPRTERLRGEVQALKVVDVIEQADLTLAIVQKADRISINGLICNLETWDAPDAEPRMWTFYGREIKQGAVKR